MVNNSRASAGSSRAKLIAATAIATAVSVGVSAVLVSEAAIARDWKRSSARSHAAVRMPSRLPKR